MLQMVIGSSAVSIGVLLGTFMGGMCLGSLALPRVIPGKAHPLRVYAMLELGIGIIGIAVLFGMPYVGRLYIATVGRGLAGILLRGAAGAVCLLPPTLLMGATLPAIARWVETTPKGVSWMGFFYGGNIAGAVTGCLLAGFYLLRVYDMATATYVAATLNLLVAVVGIVLSTAIPYRAPERGLLPEGGGHATGFWAVYVAIALSGLGAMGAEVVWTRILSLLLGGTVYTFSIILAVFLLGLWIGSSAGAYLSYRIARPRVALGICQMLLAAAIAWAAFMLARSLPYWPVDPFLSPGPVFIFQIDLVRCMWAILPPSLFWGASFPLALASVASPGQDPGRMVGGVYAANTVGAIIGSIGFSIAVIPLWGTQDAERLLIALAVAAALVMVVLGVWWPVRAKGPSLKGTALRAAGLLWTAVLVVMGAGLVWSVSPIPGELVAHGRAIMTMGKQARIVEVREGMNASIAVTEWEGGTFSFHVGGRVEASTLPQDMRLQRILGHIPALLHPDPRTVLVVGCGAGVTAGTFLTYPGIETITICEIEPLIPTIATRYFAAENYGVVTDPRVRIVYDDARHYILTTKDKFDIITSDPIHPWVKGSATLFTKEYFDLCKHHLNPGGQMTQWVPLYESEPDTIKSELATFFDVFPDGIVWGNTLNRSGYDVVLFASNGPMRINVDEIQQRLARPRLALAADSLAHVGFHSAIDLLSRYGGRGADLAPWMKGAEINRDRNLRLQYLAGLGLDTNQGGAIYGQILNYRKFPEDLFVGSEASRMLLQDAIERAR
jgi:spermidine synthase